MILNVARKIFQRHPILVNSAVYGGLYVGAEFCQQVYARKIAEKPGEERDLDFGSLARYLVVGSGINSHYLYFWYKWLDGKFVGTSSGIVMKKLLLDQLVMTPPLYVIFYLSMSIMEGQDDIFAECREKYVKTLLTSYVFWVPVQVINFVYLPNKLRVIYLGACSFAWMSILCWIKSTG